jgi:hypothetical protein
MHSPALLVLCLLVWVPTLGYAQSEEAPPPVSDAPTAPPLVTAPEEPEEPEEPPRGELFSRDRISAEASSDLFIPRMVLSPILGGVATSCGVVLGFIVGVVISECDLSDGDCDEVALWTPTILAGWATGSLAVYGMGNFLNGRGTLGPTMLGGALGMGLGIALLFATEGTAWYAAPLAPGLGAAIGYEIANSYVRSTQEPERDEFAGVQLMPVLGRTAEGGLLGGLAGRF